MLIDLMGMIMRNISRHPYLYTGLLFVFILGAGLFLRWPQFYYAFMLLLYFIVTIGIKLDDISRQIATTRSALPELLNDGETIIRQLKDIHSTLSAADPAAGSGGTNTPADQ